MNNFFLKEEKKISNQFLKKGYVIKKIDNIKSITSIINLFIKTVKKNLGKFSYKNANNLLNYIHKKVEIKKLNSFRLKIINDINKSKNLRELYYKISNLY